MSNGLIIKNVKLEWLGHSGFKIECGKKIFIDPYKINTNETADFVLITHDHHDHCSIEDLKKIVGQNTIIILPVDCISALAGKVTGKTVLIEPTKKIKAGDILIEAVNAYNTNKHFHPKQNNWVGYIVEVNGVKIYHAGDTDRIPEMKQIKCDVALLPVSGTYVMTAEEAALAVNEDLKPKLAIPMHFGAGVVGTITDAEKFKSLCKCDVKILEKS